MLQGLLGTTLTATLLVVACGDDGAPPGGSDDGAGTSGTGPSGSGGLAGTSGSSMGGTSGSIATGGAGGVSGSGTGGLSGASGASGAAGTPSGGTGGQGGSAGAVGGAGAGGVAGGASGTAGVSGAYTCPSGVTGMPLPPNPMPQPVAGVPPADSFGQGFSILEGPVWINGSLYVSQIAGNATAANGPTARILKITGTTVVVWAETMTGTNGLALHPDGRLLGARHWDGSISSINLATPSMIMPIAAQYMSARFNSPNDLVVRNDGNIYFTDPSYQAPTGTPPQSQTRVYRVNPMGTVTVVDGNRSNPNGIILSLNQNTLYVSGSAGVFTYPVMGDGSVGMGTMVSGNFGGSDGLGIDCAGNVYVTMNQDIAVLGTAGSEIARFSVSGSGVQSVTNVAFGGDNHQRMYITTLGSTPRLFALDVMIPGLPY